MTSPVIRELFGLPGVSLYEDVSPQSLMCGPKCEQWAALYDAAEGEELTALDERMDEFLWTAHRVVHVETGGTR